MAAYLVACIEWHDHDAIDAYGGIVRGSLAPYGGKYLARGSPFAELEGTAPPKRLAVVEFPTAQAAREWHASAAYAPARKIRDENATTHWVVIVDGVLS